MFETRGWRRVGTALELLLCVVLVAVISLNALRRMDYFGDTAETMRMTDASRTALVARNIVDGNGYTTNDLPAALVDFYDQQGKLHAEHWVNADRFPFASYAIAALYEVTRSTSWQVGILVYNLLCFIAFLVLLYHCGKHLWDDRYAGLAAVTIALLHPYTYMFLYWKDGDMLLLTLGSMALMYRYFQQQPGARSWKLAIGLGTLLAWLFLSRPNLGAPFILVFGIVALARLWRTRKKDGFGAAFKHHIVREGLVLFTALVWCIPFVIHSMREWGQPLFSANNLYQLPLGTRFGMGTDTWWKYTEPGHTPTFSALLHDGTGELGSKFTSSWVATLKHVAQSYAVEILLACGLAVWLGRRPKPDPMKPEPKREPRDRAARLVGFVVLFAFVINLAMLPLYGYQEYSYRHYLAFGLPLLWIAAGRAVALMGPAMRDGLRKIGAHVSAHRGVYAVAAVVAVIGVNVGATDLDANRLFGRISAPIGAHWVAILLVAAVVLLRRYLFQPPWFPRIVIVAFSLVYACYRPNPWMKRANLVWLTADSRVWDTMRQRSGIVSSFALQGEVAWNTGRKNIPAPEWPMHIYSLAYDHDLEVQDVYVESAAALISTLDGPFSLAAPGFEGYARLQHWQHLPGYEVAFHGEAMRGYPQFKIKPHFKASTDWKLVDRGAIEALRHSPERIDLGDPKQVIYTAHGWGDYYTLDGKPSVLGTDATRSRYTGRADAPYEDAGITFFLDDRRPKSVEFELYAPAAMTYDFYWNLDLYAYDRPKDRKAHAVGEFTSTGPGWTKVRIDIPEGVTRKGLNKLGFRVPALQPAVLCPEKLADGVCLQEYARQYIPDRDAPEPPAPVIVRPTGITAIEIVDATLFAGSLEFHY